MKISIAMATYNGAKFLSEQLNSFVEQIRLPDELVVTDDCSTDDTLKILESFAENAPFPVRIYRNESNLGYAKNFDKALSLCTGDLIFLSDQDDVWFPEKIAHMAGVAERNPDALVVMNDAALTDAELNEVGLTTLGQIRSAGLGMESFVMGCCIGVKRELLDICLPIPDGYKAHDNWIVGLADGLNARVIEDIPLQYYRRHASNTSQFLANRITRVTRFHVFIHRVKNLFHVDAALQNRASLEQTEIFANGIGVVREKAPSRYYDDLQALEERLRQQIKISRARMEVRKKPLLRRIVAVCDLFIHGGYNNTSVLMAVMRDIVKRDS